MERARVDGTTPELLGKWFTELKALMDKNGYLPENIFNMDENWLLHWYHAVLPSPCCATGGRPITLISL